MVGIYSILSPTNKIYIGQSFNILKRFRNYRNLSCTNQIKVYNSLKKHGISTHIFNIVEEMNENVDIHFLNEREQYWINYYKNLNYELLNIRDAGSNGKLSEETKNKLRIKAKGKKLTEAHKNKISKNSARFYLGKKLSKEHKLKIGNSNLGKKRTNEFREFLSTSQKGKKQRIEVVEHRAKLNRKSIIQLTLENEFIKTWPSMKIAGNILNIKENSISQVCTKKYKSAGGFKWRYNNTIIN